MPFKSRVSCTTSTTVAFFEIKFPPVSKKIQYRDSGDMVASETTEEFLGFVHPLTMSDFVQVFGQLM